MTTSRTAGDCCGVQAVPDGRDVSGRSDDSRQPANDGNRRPLQLAEGFAGRLPPEERSDRDARQTELRRRRGGLHRRCVPLGRGRQNRLLRDGFRGAQTGRRRTMFRRHCRRRQSDSTGTSVDGGFALHRQHADRDRRRPDVLPSTDVDN